MKNKAILVGAVVVILLSSVSTSSAGSFQGLGDLPGNDFYSSPSAISADGKVIVGVSHSANGTEAFRWENGAITPLGDLPGGDFSSIANDVSYDGTRIVGYSNSEQSNANNGREAFVWENGTMTGLGFFPQSPSDSSATGISDDGSVISGWARRGSLYPVEREAAIFSGTGNLTGLGYKVDDYTMSDYTLAYSISGDGSVVAGVCGSYPTSGFYWKNGNMLPLTNRTDVYVDPRGVSYDGSVIVGCVFSPYEAFRWENGEMIGLGTLFPATLSGATAVSADGSVIVGWSESELGDNLPFIWDENNGMRNLIDILTTDLGLDLGNWKLGSATGISADGLTIVGQGVNPDGYNEGWVVTIPEPCTLLFLGFGAVLLKD